MENLESRYDDEIEEGGVPESINKQFEARNKQYIPEIGEQLEKEKSGAQTSAEFKMKMLFSGEKDYEDELKQFLTKTKSPFSVDRAKQRSSEIKKILNGHLIEKLEKINNPITYISGELDSVYPSGDREDKNSQLAKVIEAVKDKTKIDVSIMKGLRHNTTIAPDEITAANIDHYLSKAEEKNKKEKE